MNKIFYSALFILASIYCEAQNIPLSSQNKNTNNPTWDTSYGGADKSFDTELLRLREIMAPQFQTLEF